MKKIPEARSASSRVPVNTTGKSIVRPRSLALLPLVRDIPSAVRLLRDKGAPLWSRALVVLAVAYVVWPLDLIPDVVPVLSWADDMGVVLVLRLLLHREIERYREGTPAKAASRTIGIDSGAVSA